MGKAGTKIYRERKFLRIILSSMVALFFLASFLYGCKLLQSGLKTSEKPELHTLEATAEPTEPQTEPPTEAPTEPSTEAPTEEPTAPPPEISPEQLMLDAMSLEEKICQLFMVAPEALTESTTVTAAPEDLAESLKMYPVGGIILFADNLVDREQCVALIQAFQDASGTPLLIGVDEEGGIVSRLGAKETMGVTHFDPMGDIGETGDTALAYAVGQTLGQELRELGFNLDFAPVADINTNPKNPVIGNRAFGEDPLKAADMVAACVQGFQAEGMISCLKHFPGHGDTAQDSHSELAVSVRTPEDLYAAELIPFQKGLEAGAPTVMVGHISLPQATDDGLPATLSPQVVGELLRIELGFEGVVITDAMNMSAITKEYPQGEAVVLALQAGCDLILMPESLSVAVEAVKTAVAEGVLTEERINESVMRILELKLAYGVCPSN